MYGEMNEQMRKQTTYRMNGNNSTNNNNSFSAILSRYAPSYKLLAIVGWSLLVVEFIVNHTRREHYIDQPLIDRPPDRSTTYHVKVLPSMNDEELEKLPPSAFSYMTMIDAGSSGCRAHVYRYGKVKSLDGPLYIVPKHDSRKVKPGLSSFAAKPQDAGASLKDLVEFIKTQVPQEDWATTPIWLKATAGLRMLDGRASDAILDSVRSFLLDKNNSPLLFKTTWARIIPGVEEGAFGWISYNYLKQIIGPKRTAIDGIPYTVVELGGASAQVTQLAPTEKDAKEVPDTSKYSFTIEGQSYSLYTHSYLGYGAEQARESLNKMVAGSQSYLSDGSTVLDPCINKGYSRSEHDTSAPYEGPKGLSLTGNADSQSCSLAVKELFSGSKCDSSVRTPVSFGCVYQPKFVPESQNVLVFENYYYTANAIGLHGSDQSEASPFPRVVTVQDMVASAKSFCNMSVPEMTKEGYPKDGSDKENNLRMCFISSFMASFLADGLHFPSSKQVTIQQSVGNSDIEWALGAAYKEAADLLKKDNLRGSGN